MHETGFIHRDLKPQNLRVTPDGWLKILDFGLAKRSLPNSEGVSQALTESQDLAGTAPYLAPEVWGVLPPASDRTCMRRSHPL